NYTAYFSTQYRVIVDSQPAYLQIVVDGMTYNTTYPGWWNASEPHALGAPSPQPMGPDVRWVWESWSDGGLRSHAVSVTGPARFVAPRRGGYTAGYRQQEQVAPPVAMNWKPVLAAACSLILLLVGIYRSWRRPYPFRGSKHRSLVTFLLFSGAFVGGEAGTGILCLVTGVLAI